MKMKNRKLILCLLLFLFISRNGRSEDVSTLPEGGGDPGKAYLELHARALGAVKTENMDQLKDRTDGIKLAEDLFDGATYPFFTIIGGKRQGNRAMLDVTAQADNQTDSGTVTMSYDGKNWLYERTQWKLKFGRSTLKSTMSDMRSIVLAIAEYEVEYEHYPKAGGIEELAKLLQPAFIDQMIFKDAWNNQFVYRYDQAKNQYWLISYGTDNKPEEKIYNKDGYPLPEMLQPEKTTHKGADIICTESLFVRYPEKL